MTKSVSIFNLILAGFFYFLALIILSSLIFHLLDGDIVSNNFFLTTFALPGQFLFTSFLWAAFLIPLLLFVNAYLIVYFSRQLFIFTILSIFPFVTISVLLRILFSDIYGNSLLSDFTLQLWGKNFSIIFISLLLVLEFLFILLLAKKSIKRIEKPEKIAPHEGQVKRVEKAFAHNQINHLLLESPKYQSRNMESNIEQYYEGDSLLIPNLGDNKKKINKQPINRKKSYNIPVDGILNEYGDNEYWKINQETQDAGQVLMRTLQEFNIEAELTGIKKGPVITMFEILPAPGVKLSKIVNLADNFALRLAASRVRIVAPIPGKHAVGIEVPNKKRAIVSFREMITDTSIKKDKYRIPISMGKDITGEAKIVDLTQTPHLLIAGATGSGKSVCVNSIICSILYTCKPSAVRLLLIDPKIVELKYYNDIPHLLTPVITDSRKAFQALQYCISEMEHRYSLLDSLDVRDIHSFNKKVKKQKLTVDPLPYIVIIIDEFADLMTITGKEMESTLARLAAMSRAVGLHIVLATQRPSIDVITGLIKANIPSRIAFMVASKFDSRIIIDTVGAEKLLGAGDMLFVSSWEPFPKRLQGAYLSEEEVEAITSHVKTLGPPDYIDEEIFIEEEDDYDSVSGETDPMMDKALDIILAAGKASASYLQRKLKIGYNRAARIIEEMELRGIVGPPNGSKPREIIHVPDRVK